MKRNLVLLDLVRGCSALIVVAGHLADLLFLGTRPDSSAWYKLFQLVVSQGHAAVMVFFVMSGFLVGKHVRDTINTGAWSWKEYAIRRLTRLWIVLIPALALTALWDQIGIRVFDGSVYSGLLSGPLYAWSLPDPIGAAQRYDLETLFGNMFFLQTISFPLFGTNGPLWSLCNEFWYYVLFPLVYILFKRDESARSRALSAVFGAIVAVYLSKKVLAYGVIWLLGFGTVVADDWFGHRPKSISVWMAWAGSIAFAGLLYTFSRLVKVPEFLSDIIIALTFSTLLFFLLRIGTRNLLLTRMAGALAAISYSLYLTHFPFLVLMTVAINDTRKIDHDLVGSAIYVSLLCMALLVASIFYWVFERHTAVVQFTLLSKQRPTVEAAPTSATNSR